jgi:vacuolar-type H+-ATPase subunit I/STV1
MGVAHSIDVNGKRGLFDDLLEEYAVPCEVATQCSDILTRVDCQLAKLEQKPEELSEKTPLPSKTTLKEILDEMEKKLSEIEDRSQPFIESITLSSNLLRKIDQTLHTWKINPKKAVIKNTSLPEKAPQEMLLNAEQRLSELERSFDEIDKTATRCSNALSRISQFSKNLKVKVTEVSIQKVPFPPDEKFFAFVESRLSEIGNALRGNASDEALTNELLTIKATISHVMEQAPEAKAGLIKQTLELRSFVDMVKKSIRANPELQAIHFDLLSLREMVREIDELIKVESNMGRCATTVFFEAWVPKLQLEKVVEEIKNITQGKCVIEEAPPTSEDVVPTVIKPVPRFFEAFEKLTFSLGYPRPEEINPVYVMAITFPFLFGIMFADVGQGAILLTLGVILLYFRGKVDINKVGDILRYFLFAGGLFVLCGISAICFGFLFGEFFGPSGVLHPIMLITIGPFQIGGFDPMHEPLNMLRFAIFIGVIILSLGLVLRVVNNIKKHRLKLGFISSCWMWLLLGGFFMWVYWGGISNITRWFAEGTLMFLGLIVSPVVLICIVTATSGSIMEGIDFSIEVLIESLDHTISFSRLAALFLTHTALNYMFLIIAGVENGVFSLQSIPIIMVGSILALSIEGLVIFVHCLRLHWVELLPEFYSGKGIPYKPLKVK